MVRLVAFITLLGAFFTAGCNRPVHWKSLPQTKDGGTHWEKTAGQTVGGFQAVSFIDMQRGWVVNKHGQVWRTADGGVTWAPLGTLKAPVGVNWVFNSAEDLRFSDELNGWIVETFTIWRTEDGGVTWEQSFSASKQASKGQPGRSFFVNARRGWVCGTSGEVYSTEDGGRSWSVQTIGGENTTFSDVFFSNQGTGWLLGYTGGQFGNLLYRTDDGGKTWRLIQTNIDRAYLTSLYFFDEKEGWASGEAWSNRKESDTGKAVLMRTTDGGKTWGSTFTTGDEPFFDRIRFLDQRDGWLFARDRVYRTDDSGKNWQAVLKLSPVKSE